MNDQQRKRKRTILILIILFLFLAIAGGDKLRDGQVNKSPESADASFESTAATQMAGTSASPTSGISAAAGTPESTPGSSSAPSNQPEGSIALQSHDAPTGTPTPTSQPTPTATPTVSVSPTPNPTPSSSPIMTQTGVQGRMMMQDNCPVMPDGTPMGTCMLRPYQGVASLYKSGSNAFVKQVTAQSDGAFWVMLEPGTYYFVHNGQPSLDQTYVTVPSSGFAIVTLTFK